ncbi:NAD(P)H-binding protein [Massilia sp. SYSU DXS3249]
MPATALDSASGGRRVLLAGATGLVGGELLRGLLADDTVAAVHVLARRPLEVRHPKLRVQVVDFTALPGLPALDEAYLALGTTIKVAGSQAAFRAVDFDANLAVARAACAAGARRLGLVSAMGADARARVFYNRVKGELEEAVRGLGFEAVVIARPSLLLGDRAALGQPARAGEHLGALVAGVLRPLIPVRYRPIRALDVARALLARVPGAQGEVVLPSDAMQAERLT